MFNIKGTVKGYIYDCCEKYAKKNNLRIDDVQLIMSLNVELKDNDTLEVVNDYFICEKYEKKVQYTFLQVLGIIIDFLGRQMLAEPFIRKSIIRFSQEHNIEIEKTRIVCVPFFNEDKKNKDVSLFLYNGGNYVPTTYVDNKGQQQDGLSFDDLFRDEDFELPNM